MNDTVEIYPHFDGFGILCHGRPREVLSITRVDTFFTAQEAFIFAKQVQKDTDCDIVWTKMSKPSWACDTSDDTK